MNRADAEREVESRLRERGFVISRRCDIRPGSFDYVASREDVNLLVKVSLDIDSVIEEAADEMKRLSRALRSLAFIVGERTGRRELSRGTAYFRYGVPAVSFQTFDDLLDGQPILVYAGPGGEYAELEGHRLRQAREGSDLSRGELASRIGVSRSMVRRYEEEEANATVNIVIRLEEALDEALIKPVDLTPERGRRREFPEGTFEALISRYLRELGLDVSPFDRAPFNAVSSDDDRVVLANVSGGERQLSRRAPLMKEISEVLDSRSVFIMREKSDERLGDIPLVGADELSDIEEPGGLFDLLEERCA